MKFLCVECDEPMKLEESRGPQDGSMTVIFSCIKCGRQIAMLTNKMETQMVKSLDVKIGAQGPDTPQPMEMLKKSLTNQRGDIFSSDSQDESPETQNSSGSKCPFSGVVADAFEDEANAEPAWAAEALERIQRIPSYVQPMVKKGIEEYAREKGYAKIDLSVLEEAKGRFGM